MKTFRKNSSFHGISFILAISKKHVWKNNQLHRWRLQSETAQQTPTYRQTDKRILH